MHEWLVFPEFGAWAPALQFAAGALAAALVQCLLVAARGLLTRRRKTRGLAFPPDDPTRIWAELKDLRAECVTSVANLETAVARLRDTATVRLDDSAGSADRLVQLQRALAEKETVIAALEQEKTELGLVQEQLLLQLHRQDGELASRAAALATAEQTIGLLQGLIGMPESAPPAPRRAAG